MSKDERVRIIITVGLLSLIVVGAFLFFVRRPPAGSVEIVLPPPTDTPQPAGTPAPIQVYVCGAVAHPDVYQLAAGSIVKDAIKAAGGATEDADLIRINLADALLDHAQVYVPVLGEEMAATEMTGRRVQPLDTGSLSGLVDINSASLEVLESLPGIGPVLAQRIVDHRPYRSIEDILEVPGIGEATYHAIEGRITVDQSR